MGSKAVIPIFSEIWGINDEQVLPLGLPRIDRFLNPEHRLEAEIVALPDYEHVFAAFDSHEADMIAVESNGTYGRSDAEILCTFGTSDYYLCVSSSRPDLLEELNRAQTMLNSEEPNYLTTLSEKYYPYTLFSRAFSVMERDWMNTHSEVKVGYLAHYLPYSDTDENGDITGLIQDVTPRIFETLGIDLAVSYHGYDSFDDMIAAVNSGDVDAVFPIGGGLYFSEENGIYQSAPVIPATNELIFALCEIPLPRGGDYQGFLGGGMSGRGAFGQSGQHLAQQPESQ